MSTDWPVKTQPYFAAFDFCPSRSNNGEIGLRPHFPAGSACPPHAGNDIDHSYPPISIMQLFSICVRISIG